MQQLVKESALSYYSFVDDITELVSNRMGEGYDVRIYKVTKNNSLELESLIILKKGENYSPNIYLLPYYEAYCKGTDLLELVGRIIQVYENYSEPIIREKFYYGIEEVRNFVTYRLVNFQKNRKLLENIPYIRYLDLAITFHCLVRDDSEGIGTIRITNEHLHMWEISQDELMELAVRNTIDRLPPMIKSMEEVIWGMIQDDSSHVYAGMQQECFETCFHSTHSPESHKMYILTNQKGINGATCLLYKDILKDFSNQIKSDLYILPSSIHEVILVPFNKIISKKALNEMVVDVNRTQVSREEVLSDRVYYYSRQENAVTMIEI